MTNGFRLLGWDGQARMLGTLWTLERAGQRMTCELWTHPVGWEVRVVVAGDLVKSETVKSEAQTLALADDWVAEAESQKWARK